jgi:hypothetical protein
MEPLARSLQESQTVLDGSGSPSPFTLFLAQVFLIIAISRLLRLALAPVRRARLRAARGFVRRGS